MKKILEVLNWVGWGNCLQGEWRVPHGEVTIVLADKPWWAPKPTNQWNNQPTTIEAWGLKKLHLNLVWSLIYTTIIIFSISNKKVFVENNHVALPDHALDSNKGMRALSTYRGSHLCAWFGGSWIFLAMATMNVENEQFCGNPIVLGKQVLKRQRKNSHVAFSIKTTKFDTTLPRPILN